MTLRKKSCNILVVGQTGAGKSSLINYLLGEPRAAVGVGRPITSKDEISSYRTTFNKTEFNFFDSWGIETDKAEDWKERIKRLISTCDRHSSEEGVSWFHTVLYCIPCGNARVQPLDLSMIRWFKKEGYSVVVVLSKADQVEDFNLEEMKNAISLDNPKIPVSSGGKDRYGIISPYGKEELFIAIIQAAITNLPERLRIYSHSLISSWKLYTEVALEGKEISWWDNSELNHWINKRANDFAKELNTNLSKFITDEFSILNSMISNTQLEKTETIHISPPPSPELSAWETALIAVFLPILTPVAVIYGLICGKDDEKTKLLKMISEAAKELQELADNYVDEVKIKLSKVNRENQRYFSKTYIHANEKEPKHLSHEDRYPSLAKSPLNGKEPKLLSYKELKQEIVCYAKNPSQCIDERSRLREIAHYYLLKRAEEVRNLPIDQQAEKARRLNAELTGIIRTQKAGQNIRSAIQGAISRMGNNDKFHLLESDQTITWKV